MNYDDLLKIARSFAARFTHGLPSSLNDDIQQECYIAIHRAVESYKPEKGASLKSWIYFHVQDQMGKFRRAERDGMRPFARDDRPCVVSMWEGIPSLTETNEQDVMLSCRQILNNYELAMLINASGINGVPETITQMAKTLGINRVEASRHLYSARAKMQESLDYES